MKNLIVMNEPMIIWYILVVIAIVASSMQLIHYLHRHHAPQRHAPVHILGMSREKDILFVPGDETSDDYGDDFEDL